MIKTMKETPEELSSGVFRSLVSSVAREAVNDAKIKVMVKKILRKHGYLPDLQEEAVKIVLMQAELLCADWV